MRNTLRKSEILRGYSVFSDILKNGESVKASVLQCYFKRRQRKTNAPAVCAVFAVPRKNVARAVDRNKVKRLLREAFRKNKERFHTTITLNDVQLSVVIIFRNADRADVRRMSYSVIESALNDAMSKIISRV